MKLNNKFSFQKKWKYLFICLLVISAFSYHTFQRTERIDWDVFGYYLYLPAQFIHNDINLQHKAEWLNPAIEKYKLTDSFYQAYKTNNGKYVFKYTMGMSILYSPFFFIADTFSKYNKNYERDGFSLPYQIAMRFFILLMIFIGLFFLYKILLLYFSEKITLLTLFVLVFGTNYYVMSFADGLMPHLSLFTLFSTMFYFALSWYKKQKIQHAIIIGVCLGLAVLIRPTSIVVVIIPLLWGVENLYAVKERFQLFIKYFTQLILLAFFAFLILLPQLIYWKTQTNNWLFYSYPDEKLNLFTPHLTEVLFSYKKGWLLYTPLMFFALLGFFAFYKNFKSYFFSVFIFFLLNTYIISAWDCWWYGGSFAHRAFVESYVFMAFPLAALFDSIFKRISSYTCLVKGFLLSSFFFLLLFIIFLNIFQTHQALNGVIHTSRTTKEFYWKIFLKNSVSEKDKMWLEPEPYYTNEDEFNLNEYSILDSMQIVEPSFENNNAEFSSVLKYSTNLYKHFDNRIYLNIIAKVEILENTNDSPFYLVGSINLKGKLYKYRSKEFNKQDVLNNNRIVTLSMYIPPQVSIHKNEISCYIYNPNKNYFKINLLKAVAIKSI